MPFVKIKLTGSGMDSFHGDIAGEKFENGISVEALPLHMADRIAATHEATVIDEDGEEMHQAGIAARLLSVSAIPAEAPPEVRAMTEDEWMADRLRAAAERGDRLHIYTADELEKLALQDGIAGLRDIAGPWGVKGREINQLIRAIIKAQDKFKATTDKIEAERQEQRKVAERQVIAAQESRQREIIDQGKHWSPDVEKFETIAERKARLTKKDETPNALGPNGEPIYIDPDAPKAPVEVKPTLVTNEDAPKPAEPANDVVVEGAA